MEEKRFSRSISSSLGAIVPIDLFLLSIYMESFYSSFINGTTEQSHCRISATPSY